MDILLNNLRRYPSECHLRTAFDQGRRGVFERTFWLLREDEAHRFQNSFSLPFMKLPETAGMMSEFPHLGFSKRLKMV